MKIRLFILFIFSCSILSAQTPLKIKDLKGKREAILSDIEKTNQLLNENKETTSTALTRLNLLAQKIYSRKQLIEVLNNEIEALNTEIDNTGKNIDILEGQLKIKKSSYAKSIQKMYNRKSDLDQVLFILSAKSFSESYHRMLYLKEFANWQKKQGEAIIQEHEKLRTEKQKLEASKQSKLALVDDRKREESKLVNEESSQKQEVKTLQTNQKKLLSDLKEKKKQAEDLNRKIEKAIAEEIARVQREARIAAEKKARAEAEAREKERMLAEQKKNKKTTTTPHSTTSEKVDKVDIPTPTPEVEPEKEMLMTKEDRTLSSNFANNRGILPYPLKGTYRIVGHYGVQQHPDLKHVTIENKGVNILTTPGNDSRAVFEGVVTSVMIEDRCVIIRHGNYLTVYAGLEKVYVKKGDHVSTGQSIGQIHTDRNTGETILQFQLWKEREKLNPENWLIR